MLKEIFHALTVSDQIVFSSLHSGHADGVKAFASKITHLLTKMLLPNTKFWAFPNCSNLLFSRDSNSTFIALDLCQSADFKAQ